MFFFFKKQLQWTRKVMSVVKCVPKFSIDTDFTVFLHFFTKPLRTLCFRLSKIFFWSCFGYRYLYPLLFQLYFKYCSITAKTTFKSWTTINCKIIFTNPKMFRFFVWSHITARILMFQRKSSNICLKVHQNGGDIAARYIFVFRF